MRNSAAAVLFFAVACAFGPAGLSGQTTRIDPRSTMHITLPEDSPVTVVSADWGESSATARGGAMLLDLHTSLSLRNSSQRRICGLTLLVAAQEVTPGGKGSVSVANLNVGPGENFPVRIDLRLLRPLQAGTGPLVEMRLDGVLFDDLSFFGPNVLNSRRLMTVWEQEARRDRRYFRAVLDQQGAEGVRREILGSLERQVKRSRMEARVQPGAVSFATSGRQIQLAMAPSPGAPLELSNGTAQIAEDEARRPAIFLRNQATRSVRSLELSWLVRDLGGREFITGPMALDLDLPSRARTRLVQDISLKFTEPGGRPIVLDSMTAFLSSVEFDDGSLWVPDRAAQLPSPSAEEQRLGELYRKRGLSVVLDELKKY